jgi:hypothetical protein
MGAGQVKVAADPDPVGLQARQPGTSRQPELIQLSAFNSERRVELAVVKTKRERDLQPGQIQGARHRGTAQPDPATINLIPQLITAAAKQRGIHGPAGTAVPAFQNPSR